MVWIHYVYIAEASEIDNKQKIDTKHYTKDPREKKRGEGREVYEKV